MVYWYPGIPLESRETVLLGVVPEFEVELGVKKEGVDVELLVVSF